MCPMPLGENFLLQRLAALGPVDAGAAALVHKVDGKLAPCSLSPPGLQGRCVPGWRRALEVSGTPLGWYPVIFTTTRSVSFTGRLFF